MSYRINDKRGQPKAFGTLYPSVGNSIQYRPRFYTLTDTQNAVQPHSRRELMRYARELFATLPNLGGAILQKNTWAFANGWSPVFTGEDKAWGELAEQWLINSWYPVCNVRGPNYDFVTSLLLDGIAKDIDGDNLMLLTEAASGFPAIQFIPAHRISSGNEEGKTIAKGPYKGLKIVDGVILNASNRPVGYRILQGEYNDTSNYIDVSAREGFLGYEAEFLDQVRGVPKVGRCVLDLLDTQDIDHFLKRAVKLDSSQGILHYTESGEADSGPNILTDEEQSIVIPAAATINPLEILDGGEIYYLKANSGEKLESFKSDRPHTNTEAFINRIERRCIYSIGWSYDILDPSKVGGASVRLVVDMCKQSIRTRQTATKKKAKLAVVYALAKAMKLGLIPKNEGDWYSWSFQMPPHITVDSGNDEAAQREALMLGTTTLADVAAKQGKDWYELREQTTKETEDLLDRAVTLTTKYKGLSLDGAISLLSKRTPNPAPLQAEPQIDNTPKGEGE